MISFPVAQQGRFLRGYFAWIMRYWTLEDWMCHADRT